MTFDEAPGELVNLAGALRELPQGVSVLPKNYETPHECVFEGFERQLHALFARTECVVTKDAPARQAVDLPFVPITDESMADEQLNDAFEPVHGDASPKACAQLEKYRHLLRHGPGRVATAIRALVSCARSILAEPALRRCWGVLAPSSPPHALRHGEAPKNAHRLRRVVEAARKILVTEQLKWSGMRWGTPAGQAILILRTLIQSGRFDYAWRLLPQSYRAYLSWPDNVVPLRPANVY